VAHSTLHGGAPEADKKPIRKPTLRGAHTRAAAETHVDPPGKALEPVVPNALELRANPQALVAYYVDQYTEIANQRPPKRVVGQVAQQVGQLADDGVDAPTIEAALRLMLQRRQNPSTLPSFILEAAAGPPAPRPSGRPEHPADRAYRDAFGVDPGKAGR
jgi:hypothetical protein